MICTVIALFTERPPFYARTHDIDIGSDVLYRTRRAFENLEKPEKIIIDVDGCRWEWQEPTQ